METGGRPACGVCAAVDVHYLKAGGARAAAVLAADAGFAHVLTERTAVVPRVPPYRPGEFYLRELPPLRAVLDDLSELGLLVVDGYADLDPGGRPGLGAHAHAEFGIPVIGVAKSRFRTANHAVPVLRGPSVRPLFVTAAGMPRADAAEPGPAHRRPVPATRRTAPRRHPRAGRPARSYLDRPPAQLTCAHARNAMTGLIWPPGQSASSSKSIRRLSKAASVCFLVSRTTSGSASLKKPRLSPRQVLITRVPSADGSSVTSTSR